MSGISINDVKTLFKKQEVNCVTIYMPTHRGGADVQQNPIRLKNLLRAAEEKLAASGLKAQEVEKLLEPLQGLLRNNPFWKQQSDGLAVFLSTGAFQYYCLPVSFKESVMVADRFHIKPLLSFFSSDGRFYVLALSQNRIRLLRGSKHGIGEIELEDVPRNIAETLKYDVFEKQLHSHPATTGGTGPRGSSSWTDFTTENILRYLKQVDRGLKTILREEKAPMVFAGVDYVHAIYREANSYPYLVDKSIAGNPDGLSAEELHKQAWDIVEPYFKRTQEEALALYRQSLGTGLSSGNIKEIVPAAYDGRIGFLFAAVGIEQWGIFDRDTNSVNLHEEHRPGGIDLMDSTVIRTLMSGGTVFPMNLKDMPDREPIAAVFRY